MKAAHLTMTFTLAMVLATPACYIPRKIFPHRGSGAERPAHIPTPRRPADQAGAAIFDAAGKVSGRRILVSLHDRRLWLLDGEDTIFTAPAAVGMDESFAFQGRTYHFRTPRGRHSVLTKEADPRWVPPDWHYFEIAADKELEPVQLRPGQRVALSDGTTIEVRREGVGRRNRFGAWWPFTPGKEIIFDDKIFIPPFGTPQREVPEVLGTHKIDLGDGYLIHGTNENQSIGQPVTHGCVRLHNKDVAKLFELVSVGVPVFIF
jgi:hypothetical protein